MTPNRRNTARRLAMALALGLIALACGPTSPAGQEEPTPTPTIFWLGETPSPSELARLEALPTYTPYPPGYVKPTDPLTSRRLRMRR